jgi:hypothetical protein
VKRCVEERGGSRQGLWDPEQARKSFGISGPEGRRDIELLYIELPVHEIALTVGSRESSRTVDFLWRWNLSVPAFIGTRHIGVRRSEGTAA